MNWLRLIIDSWNFVRAAQKKQELAGKVPLATQIAGSALMDGLLHRKTVCRRCLNWYTPSEHPFEERFLVRSVLRVQDHLPDPMLCDFCFNSVMQETNRQMTNVGTSNSGPPNLALRRLIARE
jgi:hypothetical protein